jgi:hypothetical protein
MAAMEEMTQLHISRQQPRTSLQLGGGDDGMGIHDDAVQPQGRTREVWRLTKNGGEGRDDATTYHGHMEGNGPSKTEPGGANVSVILATILKGKADREDKGQGVPKWSPTMGI